MHGVQRRDFMLAAGALAAAPLVVEAQQAAKVARIGYLSNRLGAYPHLQEAFRQGLRDLGYVEGRNLESNTEMPKGRTSGSLLSRSNWLRSRLMSS